MHISTVVLIISFFIAIVSVIVIYIKFAFFEKTISATNKDVLSKFNLLTDDLIVENIRGGMAFIKCGVFSRKNDSELFEALELNPKITQCEIIIYNADYVYLFDDEDKVSNTHEDAPYMFIRPCSLRFTAVRGCESFQLSKQDTVYLSKFLILYYKEIINDLERVEKEM